MIFNSFSDSRHSVSWALMIWIQFTNLYLSSIPLKTIVIFSTALIQAQVKNNKTYLKQKERRKNIWNIFFLFLNVNIWIGLADFPNAVLSKFIICFSFKICSFDFFSNFERKNKLFVEQK